MCEHKSSPPPLCCAVHGAWSSARRPRTMTKTIEQLQAPPPRHRQTRFVSAYLYVQTLWLPLFLQRMTNDKFRHARADRPPARLWRLAPVRLPAVEALSTLLCELHSKNCICSISWIMLRICEYFPKCQSLFTASCRIATFCAGPYPGEHQVKCQHCIINYEVLYLITNYLVMEIDFIMAIDIEIAASVCLSPWNLWLSST